jgi:hypothetical protein
MRSCFQEVQRIDRNLAFVSRHRDLVWLGALVVVIALFAYGVHSRRQPTLLNTATTPSTSDFREADVPAEWANHVRPGHHFLLTLYMSPRPDFKSAYGLYLTTNELGGEDDAVTDWEVNSRSAPLSRESADELVHDMAAAGMWNLKDGDTNEPEGKVLYTRLDVQYEGRSSSTRWRGFPPSHKRVLSVLRGYIADEDMAAVKQLKADQNKSK